MTTVSVLLTGKIDLTLRLNSKIDMFLFKSSLLGDAIHFKTTLLRFQINIPSLILQLNKYLPQANVSSWLGLLIWRN